MLIGSLQGLWDFVKFHDSIDPQVLYEEMTLQVYGHTKLARTMIVHNAPCY